MHLYIPTYINTHARAYTRTYVCIWTYECIYGCIYFFFKGSLFFKVMTHGFCKTYSFFGFFKTWVKDNTNIWGFWCRHGLNLRSLENSFFFFWQKFWIPLRKERRKTLFFFLFTTPIFENTFSFNLVKIFFENIYFFEIKP